MEKANGKGKVTKEMEISVDVNSPMRNPLNGLEGSVRTLVDDTAGSTSTISSGIGSIKSSENNSDTMSVGSGNNVQPGSQNKVLSLCQRGEWMLLEQLLRNTDKGHPDLSQSDEVIWSLFGNWYIFECIVSQMDEEMNGNVIPNFIQQKVRCQRKRKRSDSVMWQKPLVTCLNFIFLVNRNMCKIYINRIP